MSTAARRAASSTAKAHVKATALAQQFGRPLNELTNDLPMGAGGYGGLDSALPWVFVLLLAALPEEEEAVALRVVMRA